MRARLAVNGRSGARPWQSALLGVLWLVAAVIVGFAAAYMYGFGELGGLSDGEVERAGRSLVGLTVALVLLALGTWAGSRIAWFTALALLLIAFGLVGAGSVGFGLFGEELRYANITTNLVIGAVPVAAMALHLTPAHRRWSTISLGRT